MGRRTYGGRKDFAHAESLAGDSALKKGQTTSEKLTLAP